MAIGSEPLGLTSTSRRSSSTSSAKPLPELTLSVREDARGRGVGGRLLDELATQASVRFHAVVLNVHLRNPAVRPYIRGGFTVAGQGRGRYGVAMVRWLG